MTKSASRKSYDYCEYTYGHVERLRRTDGNVTISLVLEGQRRTVKVKGLSNGLRAGAEVALAVAKEVMVPEDGTPHIDEKSAFWMLKYGPTYSKTLMLRGAPAEARNNHKNGNGKN